MIHLMSPNNYDLYLTSTVQVELILDLEEVVPTLLNVSGLSNDINKRPNM